MSYEVISIKEAVSKINSLRSPGWYLPSVQRQYVWGMRYESETYICLLMDSLYRGYPIGAMVLWETDAPVAHREFLRDYSLRQIAPIVDQGQFGRHKCLIYDGQQRLQTLYSVLCYTFNGRVLCFDLLFDKALPQQESDVTGFYFIDKKLECPPSSIRMNDLFSKDDNTKTKEAMKDKYANKGVYSEDQCLIIKTNIDTLWTIFVGRSHRSIAYFPVNSSSDKEVTEIFRRLNIGGMQLNQNELTLTKIKSSYPLFEEDLYALSEDISNGTLGFDYAPSEILQFLYLLIYGTPNVDSARVKESDVRLFCQKLESSKAVLKDFFENYIWGQFRINSGQIIPQRLALLPIMAYLHQLHLRSQTTVKRLTSESLRDINKYFILSQLNAWNTQTMISRFARCAISAGNKGSIFPIADIRKEVRNRHIQLHREQFLWQPWFALKILTPSRAYTFAGAKPQVDHIFPIRLEGGDEEYRKRVDVLWNFQPVPAEVNSYKRAKHPLKFFSSEDGQKYLGEYDYLPPLSATEIWSDERRFIWRRKLKMLKMLKSRYDLSLSRREELV